ncbi:HNH endonuclease [Natronincola peptidivorans]|uniref:HNH endonuclease n=1 Tax=Natronincola peptidivorans TaxID=426128 RepID=A0A1I0EJU0_9FIRM|nr:HNH endonuclease [Natronincola peptidivorans]SET45542.1 HNH endonuclease [Natronincola peptidivorans]
MAYYIVFQNKTYHEERVGGYLWAPKRTKSGKAIYHWTNMTKVKEGDIIFSMYKRNLVSVNIAKSNCIDANRPAALDSVNLWEKEGWLVHAEYNVLDKPIDINLYIEEILPLCPGMYSPFTTGGRGNQGYLFEIENPLGEYLLGLAQAKNHIQLTADLSREEKDYIKEVDDLLNRFMDETEKAGIRKSRIGQGLFRNKLLANTRECAICGLAIKELLIASHCKPWKDCSDIERLDVHNGILLCPTHDALFDKGLITFQDDGRIIISNRIKEKEYRLLNISKEIRLPFKKEQLPYIKWHRENQAQ